MKKSMFLTFLGLRGTRSLSLFIPGMITVILLGPFIPSTFVSWSQGLKKKVAIYDIQSLVFDVNEIMAYVDDSS